jgi:NAD(P)-dependent dehydrogenase (short-subunit alcohol dehydrogenase family)
MTMASLPDGYRALVIGASGGIGSAFVDALRADPRCGGVEALHRRSSPPIDFDDEASIAGAAKALADRRFHLIINAVGVLHGEGFMPEKKLGDLNPAQLLATFRANAIGPALLMRHFAPLLDGERALMAMISAKVGSIGDNRLGGWYSYRASKAALKEVEALLDGIAREAVGMR